MVIISFSNLKIHISLSNESNVLTNFKKIVTGLEWLCCHSDSIKLSSLNLGVFDLGNVNKQRTIDWFIFVLLMGLSVPPATMGPDAELSPRVWENIHEGKACVSDLYTDTGLHPTSVSKAEKRKCAWRYPGALSPHCQLHVRQELRQGK